MRIKKYSLFESKSYKHDPSIKEEIIDLLQDFSDDSFEYDIIDTNFNFDFKAINYPGVPGYIVHIRCFLPKSTMDNPEKSIDRNKIFWDHIYNFKQRMKSTDLDHRIRSSQSVDGLVNSITFDIKATHDDITLEYEYYQNVIKNSHFEYDNFSLRFNWTIIDEKTMSGRVTNLLYYHSDTDGTGIRALNMLRDRVSKILKNSDIDFDITFTTRSLYPGQELPKVIEQYTIILR